MNISISIEISAMLENSTYHTYTNTVDLMETTAADLACKLYDFSSLSLISKLELLDSLIMHLNVHGTINWQPHREKFLIALCKRTTKRPLDRGEQEVLDETEARFSDISNPLDLDACFIFWRITGDKKYYDILITHANNNNSRVYVEARIVTRHL
jgi:hypothetical protein